MTRHIALLLTSSALAATGCEDGTTSCTLIGCRDRAHVVIDGPVEVWPNGEYFLDIRLARQHRCTFVLPVPDGVSGQASLQPVPISCTPAVPGVSPLRGAVVFRQLTGGPEGCGQVDASLGCDVQTYRIDIDADDVAVDVDVRLAVGETVLLDRTVSFEYRLFWPNGPECGPPCRSANVQMVIPQP